MAIGPVSLITSALDLSVVKLLRSAINSPGNQTPSGLGPVPTYPPGPGTIGPRPVHEPEPRFEPRPVHHPTPRIEGRPVHRPEPRIEPGPAPRLAPTEPEQPRISESPLQPPWAKPVWKTLPAIPLASQERLKMLLQRPDPPIKGSVFDTFI